MLKLIPLVIFLTDLSETFALTAEAYLNCIKGPTDFSIIFSSKGNVTSKIEDDLTAVFSKGNSTFTMECKGDNFTINCNANSTISDDTSYGNYSMNFTSKAEETKKTQVS